MIGAGECDANQQAASSSFRIIIIIDNTSVARAAKGLASALIAVTACFIALVVSVGNIILGSMNLLAFVGLCGSVAILSVLGQLY